MSISIRIDGLDRASHGLQSQPLLGGPLRSFFHKASIAIQNRARENAPVDRGFLRNKIQYEVDDSAVPEWAKIGPSVGGLSSQEGKKARAMEFGTGLRSDLGGAKRHFPPAKALDTWARRHGFPNGYVVSQAIGKKGGLKPRRYMRKARRQSLPDIKGFARELERDIANGYAA